MIPLGPSKRSKSPSPRPMSSASSSNRKGKYQVRFSENIAANRPSTAIDRQMVAFNSMSQQITGTNAGSSSSLNTTNKTLVPSNNSVSKMAAEANAAANPPPPEQICIAPGTDLTTVRTIDDNILFGGQASFGLVYEHNLYEHIHRYMDIMAIDEICYYGDSRSAIPGSLERKFSLFKPMTFVSFPPTADKNANTEQAPSPMENSGYRISSPLQHYFSALSRGQPNYFQHIILNWSELCCPGMSISDLERLFYHVKQSLTDTGKVMCIVRPGDATTLPLFASGLEFLKNNESPTARSIMSAMHTAGFNVHWSIDILPAVLPVRKWLAMIRSCVPAQLALMDRRELTRGVLELNDGMFRYQPNMVEFSDRLLFVIGAPASAPNSAVIQRLGSSSNNDQLSKKAGLLQFSGPLSSISSSSSSRIQYPSTIPKEAVYELPVDDTIKPLVEERLRKIRNQKTLVDKREYGFF